MLPEILRKIWELNGHLDVRAGKVVDLLWSSAGPAPNVQHACDAHPVQSPPSHYCPESLFMVSRRKRPAHRVLRPCLFVSRLARDSARSRGSTFRCYTGLLKYITEIRPCLDTFKILSFFTLFITSIFRRLYGALNIGKKNN